MRHAAFTSNATHRTSVALRHIPAQPPVLTVTLHYLCAVLCCQSFRLAVAYQNYPVCEIWDLRQSMTPNTKLEGFHTNGIHGVEWCPHDQRILLTAGEDGRMGVWDPVSGHLLTEYATGGGGTTHDIVWSPHMKSVFGTTSFDHYGGVSVRSLPAAGSHVPSWIKRPSGGAFAFGGKFVTVTPPAVDPAQPPPAAGTQPPPAPVSTAVTVTTLSLEPQLLSLAEQFQQVLQSGDFMGFCEHKRQTATSDDERQTWTFMKILFEDEQKQRFLLLKELGFDPPQGSDLFDTAATKTDEDKVQPIQQQQQQQPQTATAPSTTLSATAELMTEDQFFGGADFSGGDSLHPTEHEEKAANGTHPHTDDSTTNGGDAVAAADSNHTELDGVSAVRKVSAAAPSAALSKPYDPNNSFRSFAVDDEDESAIRHALIYGDFAAAVHRCLATGRIADAIVFSSFGPPQLWEETRSHYFAVHPHPFIRNVMKSVSAAQLEDLVNNVPLQSSAASSSSWKETLAVLITYTTTDRYRALVNQLADRLEAQGLLLPALLCYMCSSNVDKAVDLFSRQSSAVTSDPTLQLHHAMEKIAVFAQATSAHLQPSSFPLLSLKYGEYATLLASQGFIVGAWNYLRVSDRSGTDPAGGVLLDRLFHASYASDQPIQQQAPPFPFHVQPIGPDASLQAAEGAYEMAKRNRQAMVQHTQMQQQQQQQPHQQPASMQTPYNGPMQHPQQLQQQQQQPPYAQTSQYGVPPPQQQQPQHPAQQRQQYGPPQPQFTQQPPPQQPYNAAPGGYPAPPVPSQSQIHPPTPFPPGHYNAAPSGPAPTPHFPTQSQTPNFGPQRPPFPPTSAQPQQQPPMPHPAQHQHASSLPPQQGTYPPQQQQQFNQSQQIPPPNQQLPPPQHPQHPPSAMHPQPPAQYPQQAQSAAPSVPGYPQPGQQPLPGQPQARPQMPSTPGFSPQMPQPQTQQPPYPAMGQPQQQQPQLARPMPPSQQQPQQPPQQHPGYPQQPPAAAPTPYQPAPGQPPFMPQPGMPQQHGQHSSMPSHTDQQHAPPHQMPPPQQPSQPIPPPATPSQPRIFTPAGPPAAAPPAPAPAAQAYPAAAAAPSVPASFAGVTNAAATLAGLQFDPGMQQLVSVLEQSVAQLTQRAAPAEQRKVHDLHQRLFSLYHKLTAPSVQAGQVSPSLSAELSALVQCVQVGDYVGSKRHHTNLVKSDWTGNNEWLLALKSLLELFKKYLWAGR